MGEHVKDYLSEYVDGELKSETRQFVERHLEECLSCKSELEELQELKVMLYQTYENIAIPDFQFEEAVFAKINDEVSKKESLQRTGWLFILIGGIFLVFLTAIMGPAVYFGMKFSSALFKVSVSLLHALSGFISAVPFLFEACLFTIIMIIGISVFSVRYLLKTKTIG